MLYTQNLFQGWNKLQTLLSLLVIPLMLPSFSNIHIKEKLNIYFSAFTAGVSLNMIICFVRSSVLFLYELYCRKNNIQLDEYPYTNYFFYSYLSYFMHYGYMSMYVNMSILFLFSVLAKKTTNARQRNGIIILIALQSVFVLMLYSKAGIIALLFIYFIFLFYYLFVTKKIKQSIYILLSLISIILLLFTVIPHTTERFSGMINGIVEPNINPSSDESTQIRLMAWKTSTQLIKESPLLGYGTGDANEILQNGYANNGYIIPFKKKINSHNQFFQTQLSVGIAGLIVILLFFISLIFRGVKTKSFILISFCITTLFVYLTESYLETQVGVIYTSLFSTLLQLSTNKEYNE